MTVTASPGDVRVERVPGKGWIARMPDLNRVAEGASEQEALANLIAIVDDLTEAIEDAIDNRLADDALADPDAVAVPWEEAKAWLDRNEPKE